MINYNASPYRNTGQTYRMLLRTLIAVSSEPDKKALVLTNSAPAAEHAFRMMWQLLQPLNGYFTAMPMQGRFRLVNGSEIDFRSIKGKPHWMRGTKYDEIEVDNSVPHLSKEWAVTLEMALTRQ